jgi:predicted ATP-grasp superfamily ATP-dependent carboligase
MPPVLPRVLILGERPAVALAACRALGRAGYKVGVTGWRRREVAGMSRHVYRYERIPPVHSHVDEWGRSVRALVATGGYDVVIASADAEVASLLHLDLPVPTCPQISDRHLSLIDKGRLAALCAEASVDYPRTYRPRTAEEDEAVARGVERVIIVKAARSAVATRGGVISLPGAHIVRDQPTASRALAYIRDRGVDPIVQEYLEGEKLQAIIIRRAGTTSFRLAFRVCREFPREGGSESMLEGLHASSGIGAQLVGMLERLADAATYDGLMQAEFYRTAGGRLCVIDVNPRLVGSLAFAELLGLGMTERVVRDALGLDPVPLPEETTARRYHHLVRELLWSRARPRAIAGVLATSSVRDIWETPSFMDPGPELLWLTRRLMVAVGRGRRTGEWG